MSAIPRLVDANGRSDVSGLIRGRSGKALRVVAWFDRSRISVPIRGGSRSSAGRIIVGAGRECGPDSRCLVNTPSALYLRGGAELRLIGALPLVAPG